MFRQILIGDDLNLSKWSNKHLDASFMCEEKYFAHNRIYRNFCIFMEIYLSVYIYNIYMCLSFKKKFFVSQNSFFATRRNFWKIQWRS